LYYYRARYYDPGLKRFTSEDPIGIAGGVNLAAYVGGNPISRRDPHGLDNPGMGPYDAPSSNSPFTAEGVANTVAGIATVGGVIGAYAGYVIAGTEVASGVVGAIGGLVVADAVASGMVGGLVIGGAVGVVAVGVGVGGYYAYQYIKNRPRSRQDSWCDPNRPPVP
jgi:uncharacterized protein RhaS with RHS repeats